MSIRMIARDLYRLQQKVEAIEKEMAQAGMSRRTKLEQDLAAARAERDNVRHMLDGRKDDGFNKPQRRF